MLGVLNNKRRMQMRKQKRGTLSISNPFNDGHAGQWSEAISYETFKWVAQESDLVINNGVLIGQINVDDNQKTIQTIIKDESNYSLTNVINVCIIGNMFFQLFPGKATNNILTILIKYIPSKTDLLSDDCEAALPEIDELDVEQVITGRKEGKYGRISELKMIRLCGEGLCFGLIKDVYGLIGTCSKFNDILPFDGLSLVDKPSSDNLIRFVYGTDDVVIRIVQDVSNIPLLYKLLKTAIKFETKIPERTLSKWSLGSWTTDVRENDILINFKKGIVCLDIYFKPLIAAFAKSRIMDKLYNEIKSRKFAKLRTMKQVVQKVNDVLTYFGMVKNPGYIDQAFVDFSKDIPEQIHKANKRRNVKLAKLQLRLTTIYE